MFFGLNLGLELSIILSAIASATAPAATIMIVRQTNSKGHYVDSLLPNDNKLLVNLPPIIKTNYYG